MTHERSKAEIVQAALEKVLAKAKAQKTGGKLYVIDLKYQVDGDEYETHARLPYLSETGKESRESIRDALTERTGNFHWMSCFTLNYNFGETLNEAERETLIKQAKEGRVEVTEVVKTDE